MANSVIIQTPYYRNNLVGQNLFFTITNDTAVATQTKVKFVAELYVNKDFFPNITPGSPDLVGTFKTTPNNAGAGMWDFRNVLESFVRPDNMAYKGSQYQARLVDDMNPAPIHMIDKFSMSENLVAYFRIVFYVEYLGGDSALPNVVSKADDTETSSSNYKIYDGYVKHSDQITKSFNNNPLQAFNYGYDIYKFYIWTTSPPIPRFFTNMPMIQTCNLCDFGTLALVMVSSDFKYIELEFHDTTGGVTLQSVNRDTANGAFASYTHRGYESILHLGCYPGNLQNWSATFNALITPTDIMTGGEIRVTAYNGSDVAISETLRIQINCPELKGYEPIRLTWLNQYGGWDYYTFTKKSIKKITTQPTTYTQLGSTWNERHNKLEAFRGGQKNFKRHSLDRVTINTDFMTENYNVMFQELINSPEVYMLECYQDDDVTDGVKGNALNNRVTPVRITDNDFTTKTSANDNLVQYTFEIELSRILRTQQV